MLRHDRVACLLLGFALLAGAPATGAPGGGLAPAGAVSPAPAPPLPAPQWVGGVDVRGKAQLTWIHNRAFAAVRVYRRADDAPGPFRLVTETRENVWVDDTVEPGRTYRYRLAGVGPDGLEGRASAELAVRIGVVVLRVPEPPAWEGFLVVGDGVGLKWSSREGEDVIAWNVYRRIPPETGFRLVGSSRGTSYQDTGLEPDRLYVYAVTALDSSFRETALSQELPVTFSRARPSAEPQRPAPVWNVRRTRLVALVAGGGGVAFERPADVVVGPLSGSAYVVDSGRNLVFVFSAQGVFQRILGAGPGGKGDFRNALGLATDRDENLYVVDAGTGVVQAFSPKGSPGRRVELARRADVVTGLIDAAVGPDGRVYVVDNYNNRVTIVGPDGAVRSFGGAGAKGGSSRRRRSAPSTPRGASSWPTASTPASRSSARPGSSCAPSAAPSAVRAVSGGPRAWRSARRGRSTSRTPGSTRSRSSPPRGSSSRSSATRRGGPSTWARPTAWRSGRATASMSRSGSRPASRSGSSSMPRNRPLLMELVTVQAPRPGGEGVGGGWRSTAAHPHPALPPRWGGRPFQPLPCVWALLIGLFIMVLAPGPALGAVEGSPHDVIGQGYDVLKESLAQERCTRCHLPAPPSLRGVLPEVPPVLAAAYGASSLECFSCHDGTTLVNPEVDASRTAFHPASHGSSLAGYEGLVGEAVGLPYLSGAHMECITCHDPHNNGRRPFLRVDIGELCLACHSKQSEFGRGELNSTGNHPQGADPVLVVRRELPLKVSPAFRTPFPAAYPLTGGRASLGTHWDLGGRLAGGADGPVICVTCHAIHGDETAPPRRPDLLAVDPVREEADLFCEGCHAGQRGDTLSVPPAPNPGGTTTGRTYHPADNDQSNGEERIVETRQPEAWPLGTAATRPILCSTCHRAHGATARTSLLRQPSGENGFCEECHELMPLAYHHPLVEPGTEGCSAQVVVNDPVTGAKRTCELCHRAHNAGLGTEREAQYVPLLRESILSDAPCLRCHPAGNPTCGKSPKYLVSHFVGDPTLPETYGETSPPYRLDPWPESNLPSRFGGDKAQVMICLTCHVFRPGAVVSGDDGKSGFLLARAGNPVEWEDDDGIYLCTGCHTASPGTGTGDKGHTHPMMDARIETLAREVEPPVSATPTGRLNCDSCHRPHEARTEGGYYILEVVDARDNVPLLVHPAIDFTALCHPVTTRTDHGRASLSPRRRPGRPPGPARQPRRVQRPRRALPEADLQLHLPLLRQLRAGAGADAGDLPALLPVPQELRPGAQVLDLALHRGQEPVHRRAEEAALGPRGPAGRRPAGGRRQGRRARGRPQPADAVHPPRGGLQGSSRPCRSCRRPPGPSCCSTISRGSPTRRSARRSACRSAPSRSGSFARRRSCSRSGTKSGARGRRRSRTTGNHFGARRE